MKFIKKILVSMFALFICTALFCFAFYKYSISSVSSDTTDKIITIENGTISSIGKVLKENNLIRNEFIFKLYIRINKINNLKASTYTLNESMDLKKIVSILQEGNNYNPDVISITFNEGKNIRGIAKIIEENTNNTYDEVIEKSNENEYINKLINKYWFLTDDIKNDKIYYALEGYLFPDTYYFDNKDISVEDIFNKMLDETEKKLEPYKDKIQTLDLSIHEYFTLASLVELEVGNASDREGVAGVFYNRVKDNWSLGSDVTAYYALKIDDYKILLTDEMGLRKCDYAYNTRCNSFTGLPVGPVCNPGLESLLATLSPSKHDNYYFVADCNGKTYLTKTLTEHNNTINRLKNEGIWCAS